MPSVLPDSSPACRVRLLKMPPRMYLYVSMMWPKSLPSLPPKARRRTAGRLTRPLKQETRTGEQATKTQVLNPTPVQAPFSQPKPLPGSRRSSSRPWSEYPRQTPCAWAVRVSVCKAVVAPETPSQMTVVKRNLTWQTSWVHSRPFSKRRPRRGGIPGLGPILKEAPSVEDEAFKAALRRA